VAASYREAVVEALVSKLLAAAAAEHVPAIAIGGGVAANSLLRRRVIEEGGRRGLHVVVPPLKYCTDNAAMIGAAALTGPALPFPVYLGMEATASLPVEATPGV
ncbi:MAG: tRNA (adenosine(37)-N6)-threonylcarbamoyltransferase complex transferase subunit TsaD, partial [Acidimicrobiia bacterium]